MDSFKPFKSTEELRDRIKTMLHGGETEQTTETGNRGEGDPEPGPEGDPEKPEQTEEEEEEALAPGDWPQTAIAEVARLRQSRREIRERLEGEFSEAGRALAERTAEAEGLRAQVAELTRAQGQAAAQAPGPLGNVTKAEELNTLAMQARANIRLIEDFLDDALTPQQKEAVETYAKANGAWDEDSDTVRTGILKRWKREAQDLVEIHVPARAKQLEAHAGLEQTRRDLDGVAEELFDFYGNKESQEFKDAQNALSTVPGLNQLASAKIAAAVFALGMPKFRELLKAKGMAYVNGRIVRTKGNGEAGRRGAGARNGNPRMQPSRLPGASVKLPRNNGGGNDANLAALKAKAFGGKGTTADVEAYTRAVLGRR